MYNYALMLFYNTSARENLNGCNDCHPMLQILVTQDLIPLSHSPRPWQLICVS